MSENQIKIIECDADELAPVYLHYPRQTQAQGAYVELDLRNKTLSASHNAEIGNSVPFSVWHGHDRRYGIPNTASGEEINGLMAEIQPLVERVWAGYESVWDGNNHVAQLADDAEKAEREIEHVIEDWTGTLADVTIINDWSEWFVNDNDLFDYLRGCSDDNAFDKAVVDDLRGERVIDSTRHYASKWAIEHVVELINNPRCDWPTLRAQLPEWVLENDDVVSAAADWEE